MQKKWIKATKLADKNLLEIFSCPLLTGFMVETELTEELLAKSKEFYILGNTATPEEELEMFRIIKETMQATEKDIRSGNFHECQSLQSKRIIGMVIVLSMMMLFFREQLPTGAGKRLKEHTEMLNEIKRIIYNHAIEIGQTNEQEYHMLKKKNAHILNELKQKVQQENSKAH